jgi:hypothetical protein
MGDTEQFQRSAETVVVMTEPPMRDTDVVDDHCKPEAVGWRPRWLVDVGHGCQLGITIDDDCFLVLYPHDNDTWKPGKHIPKQVAERMTQLVASGVIG